MKGFGIYVKNDLLEIKHVKNMGQSVWLFMWCLDKMTSISEEGIGKVLGGQPITSLMIEEELGISGATYDRWIKILKIHKYINTKRTPYGVIISVNKAKKGKNDWKGETSKTNSLDNTETSETMSRNVGNDVSNKTKQLLNNKISKDILQTDSLQVNNLIKLFEQINPTISYNNKTQRKAVSDLIAKLGSEKTLATIQYAVSVFGKDFAPVITNPYQLKEKLASLVSFYHRDKNKQKGLIL